MPHGSVNRSPSRKSLTSSRLCYAPPFGSAKGPVNYVGFVASNVLADDMRICHVDDMAEPGDDKLLLDVRSRMEFKAGTIPGAVNLALDELRDHLDELPRDKKLLVLCQVGLRGYLACRILKQAGFQCRNLTGGYKTYCAVQGIGAKAASPVRDLKSDTGEKSS